ncbi:MULTISPECIES: alpha/beta hydrolase [unclassified Arthrobacter]|uniref:alpha/beta hydrolase n=1 Tax=unclassified Arthrobacter TaxID=235627 RepID=UPI000301425A|nr:MULTISPECIES: alpha/beta fold hydrolase [unclassified Arthrobacter]PVE19504.1 esterase [Arthrobacter sp. Bz4]
MTSSAGPVAFSSDGFGEASRIGILLSHGFTGSPVSLLDWAQYLADQGYAVRLPLLDGHGTTWQELARTPWQRWYASYETSYRELAQSTEKIVVAGLSMGGTLALRLAALQPVAGVVVVNPGLTIADPRARYAGVLKFVMRSVPAIANNIKKEGLDEGAYARTPVAAVAQLGRLFRETVNLLPSVTAPTLVFRSSVDPIVPESSLEVLQQRIGSKALEIVRLENSYHVATMDHDAQLIFERSAQFIQHVTAGSTA